MTEEEKLKRFWKRLIAGLLILIIVPPAIAMLAFAVIHYRQEKARPAQRIVPSLKGLDLKSAEAKARDSGFTIEVMGHDSDLPGALGTIVQQEPWEGESVSSTMIGVVIAIEDPDKGFREEQRKQLSERQKKQRKE